MKLVADIHGNHDALRALPKTECRARSLTPWWRRRIGRVHPSYLHPSSFECIAGGDGGVTDE
jgi:hypothetical protein